jgi:cell division protein FtsB
MKVLPSLLGALGVYVALRERLLRVEIAQKAQEESIKRLNAQNEKFTEAVNLFKDEIHKLNGTLNILNNELLHLKK